MTPHPRFDVVDYSRPQDCLGLSKSFVGAGSIKTLADSLRSARPEGTLGAIWMWMRDNLAMRNVSADYRWRTVSQILDRRTYIGCADHALVYGTVARACGIPVVWVKSLDVEWIRSFRNTGRFDGGNGHVFLEVFLGEKWRLLDATQDELYEQYDPSLELLPGRSGEYYAYDKGCDPRALVLSLDWEPWKAQTLEYFAIFDLKRLADAKRAWQGQGRRLAVQPR